MPLIGTGLRDRGDGTARMVPVLSRQRTRLHFKFLEGVREWQRKSRKRVHVAVKCAIEGVHIAAGKSACDREACDIRIYTAIVSGSGAGIDGAAR